MPKLWCIDKSVETWADIVENTVAFLSISFVVGFPVIAGILTKLYFSPVINDDPKVMKKTFI